MINSISPKRPYYQDAIDWANDWLTTNGLLKMVLTNIRIVKPSRKPLHPGDIFVIQLPSEEYVFGRVIEVNMPMGRAPLPGANLIYIYDQLSPTAVPQLESLTPDNLLLPPMFINRLPWSRGYCVTVDHRELRPVDLVPQYCFWSYSRENYRDLDGNILQDRVEPCGEYGLHSFRTLDDAISDAVGIERVPDD